MLEANADKYMQWRHAGERRNLGRRSFVRRLNKYENAPF
jgi:hypothetical protein